MPAAIKDKLIQNRVDQIVQLANDYDTAMNQNQPNLETAQRKRDSLIFLCVALINDNYNSFEDDLFVGRARSNVAGDFLEISLTALTGFTNGERVKSILGIAATALKGTRKSVDANFFRERTTETIALKMRAARDRVRTDIYKGLKAPVTEYPLGAAIDDIVSYLNAGTLNSALLLLAQDAGEDSKKAAAAASEAKVSRYLTAEVATEFRAVRIAAETLRGRLLAASTRDVAMDDMRAMLRQLYEPDELAGLENKTPGELFDMLQEKIEAARDDEALRKKLMKVLRLIP
jgi:hypothetical protein